jgi:transposase-like protein
MPICPKCGNSKMYKHGQVRSGMKGVLQQYMCPKCGKTTTKRIR